jgi:hypothetical protein
VCSDASRYDSVSQQKIWQSFYRLYGEDAPAMRAKAFTSRRAWKCDVEARRDSKDESEEGEGEAAGKGEGVIGDLPPMRVSLEVPACSREFAQLIQSQKEQTRRLRKRVRAYLYI